MDEWVDLTMPIRDHFRWPVERRQLAAFDAGDPFQITWFGCSVHSFTHMDAPRHMLPDGHTTNGISLPQVIGPARLLDLSGIDRQTAITSSRLQEVAPEITAGQIVIIKTCWDEVESVETPPFWTEAPYMTRDAAEWLRQQKPSAVGFDFPQDFPIRGLLTGQQAPMSEMVTHDVLLRHGVILIEYLCNLSGLSGSEAEIVALPLKLPDADGAPARVVGRSLRERGLST